MNSALTNPLSFVVGLIALVIAITIHEFAHAFAADQLGDPTPRLAGRLTLNPLAHLDPVGSLMLLLFRFGWGKPVQFDPFNLRNPRRDAAIISLAGPVANIGTAVIAGLILRLMNIFQFSLFSPATMALAYSSVFLTDLLQAVIVISVVLAIFNLIPVHPLDGFKIVGGLLSHEQAREWYSLERYGFIFLIFLIFPILGRTAPVAYILNPVVNFFLSLLLPNPSGLI